MDIKRTIKLQNVDMGDIKQIFLNVYAVTEGKGYFADPIHKGHPLPTHLMQQREDALDRAIEDFIADWEYEQTRLHYEGE